LGWGLILLAALNLRYGQAVYLSWWRAITFGHEPQLARRYAYSWFGFIGHNVLASAILFGGGLAALH
jgi:NhaP-type Na+/H+ or K+/H+ antiporter